MLLEFLLTTKILGFLFHIFRVKRIKEEDEYMNKCTNTQSMIFFILGVFGLILWIFSYQIDGGIDIIVRTAFALGYNCF